MNRALLLGYTFATISLVLACGDDTVAGGGGSGANGGSGGSGGTGATGAGAEGAGGTTDGGAPNVGGGPTDGGGGEGGGPPPVCPPDPENDTACQACGKENCCGEFLDCTAGDACTACLVCTETAANPQDCLGTECDANDPATAAMLACGNANCNEECFAGASVCDPAKNDTECTTCAKTSCCDQLEACSGDVECVTCLGCITTAADPGSCLNGMCSLGDPETGALLACANQSCNAQCL